MLAELVTGNLIINQIAALERECVRMTGCLCIHHQCKHLWFQQGRQGGYSLRAGVRLMESWTRITLGDGDLTTRSERPPRCSATLVRQSGSG